MGHTQRNVPDKLHGNYDWQTYESPTFHLTAQFSLENLWLSMFQPF